MVDAEIIHAQPSTKNQERKRDPKMHQTKNGNQWYFGMKIHVGADVNSELVHTVSVTPAQRENQRSAFGRTCRHTHGSTAFGLAHKPLSCAPEGLRLLGRIELITPLYSNF